MDDLVKRLRGEYRIPITDGLGPAGGEEPDNDNEFVRHFPVPPIQQEAADRIEELEAALAALRAPAEGMVDYVMVPRANLPAILAGTRKQVEWNGWEEPYVTERFLREVERDAAPTTTRED